MAEGEVVRVLATPGRIRPKQAQEPQEAPQADPNDPKGGWLQVGSEFPHEALAGQFEPTTWFASGIRDQLLQEMHRWLQANGREVERFAITWEVKLVAKVKERA